MADRQIENTTVGDIFIEDTGVTIIAGETFTIHPNNYGKWAASVLVDAFIDAGDLVIKLNTVDLVAEDAKRVIHEISPFFTIAVDASPDPLIIAPIVRWIQVPGGHLAANYLGDGVVRFDAVLSDTVEGKDNQFHFFNDGGNVSNVWLDLSGNNIQSNSTPGVLAHNCKLRELTYSNSRDGSDTDLMFFKNGSLLFIFEVRDKRWAYKTDELQELFSFLAGDLISVFARRVAPGENPIRLVFKMTFVNTDNVLGEDGSPTL